MVTWDLVILGGLAYCIWRPVSHGPVLYPVLAAMMLAAVIKSITMRLAPPPWLMGALFGLLLTLSLGALIGSFNNAPGLLQQSMHWFGTLVVWGAFANSFTLGSARASMWVVVLGVGACSLVMLLYIAASRGLPNLVPSILIEQQGAGAGFSDYGQTSIRWYGLSTLTAGAPILVAAAVLGSDRLMPPRALTVVCAALAVAASVLAGRRAILLLVVLAPLLVWLTRRFVSIRHRGTKATLPVPAALFGLALSAATILAWSSSFGQAVRSVMSAVLGTYFGLGSSDALTADDVVRVEQADALLNGATASPVWGHGLGADVDSVVRSEARPWQFELQYHQLAYDLGLIGVLATVLAGALAVRALRRSYRLCEGTRSSLLASSVGAVSLIAANASNPYLQAVGHGWGLALMIGLVCATERATNAN